MTMVNVLIIYNYYLLIQYHSTTFQFYIQQTQQLFIIIILSLPPSSLILICMQHNLFLLKLYWMLSRQSVVVMTDYFKCTYSHYARTKIESYLSLCAFGQLADFINAMKILYHHLPDRLFIDETVKILSLVVDEGSTTDAILCCERVSVYVQLLMIEMAVSQYSSERRCDLTVEKRVRVVVELLKKMQMQASILNDRSFSFKNIVLQIIMGLRTCFASHHFVLILQQILKQVTFNHNLYKPFLKNFIVEQIKTETETYNKKTVTKTQFKNKLMETQPKHIQSNQNIGQNNLSKQIIQPSKIAQTKDIPTFTFTKRAKPFVGRYLVFSHPPKYIKRSKSIHSDYEYSD